MSAIDKTVPWKAQPGDEVHKIFTVVCSPTRAKIDLTDAIIVALLDCREISNYEGL